LAEIEVLLTDTQASIPDSAPKQEFQEGSFTSDQLLKLNMKVEEGSSKALSSPKQK